MSESLGVRRLREVLNGKNKPRKRTEASPKKKPPKRDTTVEQTAIKLYDEKAEQYVLAGLLMASPEATGLILESNLTEDDFYSLVHRKIFSAGIKIAREGKIPDLIQVWRLLEDEVDDFILDNILDRLITPSAIPSAIETVKRLSLRRKIREKGYGIVALAVNEEDIDKVISDSVSSLVSLIEEDAIKVLHLSDRAIKAIEEWKVARERQAPRGMPSSIPDIQAHTGGYRTGVMTIIGGYPSVGKSTFSRQEALHLAKKGIPVAYITLEDPADVIAGRLVAAEAGVGTASLDLGVADISDIMRLEEAEKRLREVPLYFVDGTLTIEQVAGYISLLKYRYKCQAVFVDYIQLIRSSRRFESRNLEVAHFSQKLVASAKRHDVAVIAVSQLSREGAKSRREPRLSDLRDSGALEQDARQVIILYNEDEGSSTVIAKIAKNTFGPRGGRVPLTPRDEFLRLLGPSQIEEEGYDG